LQDYVTDSLTHHKTNVNKTKKNEETHILWAICTRTI